MPRGTSLTLKQQLAIIEYAELNGSSLRALARVFNVGKSHVGQLLKHREAVKLAACTVSSANLKNRISLRQLQRLQQEDHGDGEGEREHIIFKLVFAHRAFSTGIY